MMSCLFTLVVLPFCEGMGTSSCLGRNSRPRPSKGFKDSKATCNFKSCNFLQSGHSEGCIV